MTSHRWILAVCVSLASGTTQSLDESFKFILSNTCRTFGSGVIQPFNGSSFYVRSNCPFILTRFTHNRVECDIIIRRGDSGLLVEVEIIINKIRTVLQNGSVLVEKKSVSLPYDHTYQHIFQYGIYTKLRSSLLPLSVTWHNVPGGIDTMWVELEQELSTDMTGLCGKHNVSGTTVSGVFVCREFMSYTLDCLKAKVPYYTQLCEENIYGYGTSKYIGCSFFKEVVQQCGNSSYVWKTWRTVTKCTPQTCPGDLVYVEQGSPFVPSCSNPNPSLSNQDLTSSCVCPKGKVLNDYADAVHCVNVSNCPCVFAGRTYPTGNTRSTKCQSCMCNGGRWLCSENLCPSRCLMEGQFVTTFDGKQYAVPGKCTYVASQGLNWAITIEFSEKEASLKTVVLQLFEVQKLFKEAITELHQSGHALVFWQSSMYVHVHTSFGMKIQVQMSPEIQLYITPPRNHTGKISGLCGNSNNGTTDDFTTSSGIVENSPQPFALSWSVGTCAVNIPTTCSNTDNEIFADERCSVLNNPTGIFAKCHGHIPTDQYHTACIQRTCNCGSNLQQCMCVALDSYAKACANLGFEVGDWRKATNCTLKCEKNQEFSYNIRACNHTCRSLSGSDPRCELDDAPVDGCGCPEGTHLNQEHICTPKAACECHHYGGITKPGPVVIDGRNGKVCVHCSEYPVNTAQKTCDSLSKPLGASMTCESGCYCPQDQYEDHHGNCVPLDNCTCVYSGKVFSAGEHVKTNCKKCTCGQGQWHCKDEPCPRKCQVYGNGHYQTFDSKWYRFDGHCQYTLVEDYCGNTNGSFSVRVETVPCCDEALTCSRSIVLDLQGKVTLTLSDMKVTRRLQKSWTLRDDLLYTTHTVGLYIIISVPSRGITLIWDKHTRITVELQPNWRNRVCGLCGNFDSSEMNDLQISGSAVVSSPLAFGNSWKTATPPCSDVTTDIFPCERNSYCSAWAQRRCMLITGDTFKDCHLKVDPEPYYHACVQESCSCQFEGKFLGFCTAVAAYAEACSNVDVCVKWRTPDLCPVYCDYYNDQGECSWHYEACGEMLTCGKENHLIPKLEGCYPRCPNDAPYYDENIGECTKLWNCTCYFNGTIIQPGAVVMIESNECFSTNGTPAETSHPTEVTTTEASTEIFTSSTTTQPSTTSTTITPPTTYTTEISTSKGFTIATSRPKVTTSGQPVTNMTTAVTKETYHTSTVHTESTPEVETGPPVHTTTLSSTAPMCNECIDLKMKKSWGCDETWTEDCFHKTCKNGTIELTPVVCPESSIPNCPRDQLTKVSDGCCETWTCDCRCELYGDPHYISFQGVTFDFLDDCTYILVEEQSPHHQLTIAVDNYYCVPGLQGSCAKGIILNFQSNIATLSIIPDLFAIQATLNNVTIQPPYEEHGLRFETTGYMVSIYVPEIRSYVSLSPSYTMVVSLAMEHFVNNTQGQCGVCGGGSCIRKGGQLEEDSCCEKTAYDWVYPDPLKPACNSAPKDVPCHSGPTPVPTNTPTSTTTCPASPLCGLLDHPVFSDCWGYVDLNLKKRNCEFDSCRSTSSPCSALEQAAEECKNVGICIDWRRLTNGSCDVPCPKGLVYKECHDKLDDFCNGGVLYPGASLEHNRTGCFCPSGQFRAGNHSSTCVSDCLYCKGPFGEPRLPGEVWQSNCHLCTCNNQTRTEECFPRTPEPPPTCGPNDVLVNSSCCGDQTCVEKTCNYNGIIYQVGDRWKDPARPCVSFSCSKKGTQTKIKLCPREKCPEVRLHTFYSHILELKKILILFFNVTIDNCTTIIQMPVCQGQCVSEPR
uniref:Mucin-19-like n=1 Tax=Mastacembelus armatus TaxID=205130 RepID=A0A7N8XZ23_9TELE